MFNDGWDDMKGQFKHLRAFCCGLACVFANTIDIGRIRFSVLKWEKDANGTALPEFAGACLSNETK
jgi:hypothetical protein